MLMTAAYNEEAYLEKTIESVIKQTIPPRRWVIVSDGSTDHTDNIIRSYADRFKFIDYLRLEKSDERSFCSKVNALNAGYSALKHIDFDFIGNLDADIKLIPTYYEQMLSKFKLIPNLGIVSGVYIEMCNDRVSRFKKPLHHTPGAIQFFSRKCYEEIGGYPMIDGGEDTAVGIYARMKGWHTRSFQEIEVTHLKPLLTGRLPKVIKNRFRLGRSDFLLGMHPGFATVKLVRQLLIKPYIIGGLSLFLGYLYLQMGGRERPVSSQFIEYYRKEQLTRLKNLRFLAELRK